MQELREWAVTNALPQAAQQDVNMSDPSKTYIVYPQVDLHSYLDLVIDEGGTCCSSGGTNASKVDACAQHHGYDCCINYADLSSSEVGQRQLQ